MHVNVLLLLDKISLSAFLTKVTRVMKYISVSYGNGEIRNTFSLCLGTEIQIFRYDINSLNMFSFN